MSQGRGGGHRSSEELVELDRDHFLHPWQVFDSFRHDGPLPIESGSGCRLIDADGNSYIDAVGGLWNVQLGWGNEELVEAIADQARRLAYSSMFTDMTHVPAVELAARLAEMAPGTLNHVFFGTGGSVAIDTAFRLMHYYQACRGKPEKHHVIASTPPTTAPRTRPCRSAARRPTTRRSSATSPTRSTTSRPPASTGLPTT